MINFKNKDLLLALISCFIIISAAIIQIKPKKAKILPKEKQKKVKVAISPTRPQVKWVYAKTRCPGYNYDNMLQLLRGYRKIEKKFYSDFENFIKEPRNIRKIENTLDNLKKEKSVFYKYLRRMNTFYKRTIPTKKNTTLRYYLRTIETCIDELEDIIEKFKLR